MGGMNETLKESLEHDPLFVKREISEGSKDEVMQPDEIANKCMNCNKIRVFKKVAGTRKVETTSEGTEIIRYAYQCSSCGTAVEFGVELNRKEKWVKKLNNSITFEVPDF